MPRIPFSARYQHRKRKKLKRRLCYLYSVCFHIEIIAPAANSLRQQQQSLLVMTEKLTSTLKNAFLAELAQQFAQ